MLFLLNLFGFSETVTYFESWSCWTSGKPILAPPESFLPQVFSLLRPHSRLRTWPVPPRRYSTQRGRAEVYGIGHKSYGAVSFSFQPFPVWFLISFSVYISLYWNNFQSRFQLSFPGSFSSSFSIPFSVSLSVSQSVACRVRERRSRSEPCWRDLTSRYGITRSSLAAPRTAHRHQVRAFHDMIGWKFGSYDPFCSLNY